MRGRKPGNPKVQDLAAGKLTVINGGGPGDGDGGLPPDDGDGDGAPAWMSDANAIECWDQTVAELKRRKQYISLFRREVERYCSAYGTYVASMEAMAVSGGAVVKASTGTEILSQHWIVSCRCHEIMAKLAGELGFNPVAQVRLAGAQFDLFDQPPARTGTDGPSTPFGQFRR